MKPIALNQIHHWEFVKKTSECKQFAWSKMILSLIGNTVVNFLESIKKGPRAKQKKEWKLIYFGLKYVFEKKHTQQGIEMVIYIAADAKNIVLVRFVVFIFIVITVW